MTRKARTRSAASILLVNNAGNAAPPERRGHQTVLDTTPEEWNHCSAQNSRSSELLQSGLPGMMKRITAVWSP